jgi:molybdenum cofactor cytidylyltransferase
MKFTRIPLDTAQDTILAHTVEAGEFGLLKKGTRLTKEMLIALKDVGETAVLAARLGADDIPEDDAAYTISEAAAGDHVKAQAPFTGRSNLVSQTKGLAVLNRTLLKNINFVDPSITVATVPHFEDVNEDQMLATVKIIPFSTPQEHLDQVMRHMSSAIGSLMSVAPYQVQKIALISTRLPNTPDKIVVKSEKVMADRLAHYGNKIELSEITAHHETNISQSLERLKVQGFDLILIFGASAITDKNDVIPTAIVDAGGTIDHFGMPVDPGNLLLLAHIDKTVVIGLPGCTRSPKLNGFDWILQRQLANLPVAAEDIMNMGEGGLLKEIPGRPQPRERKLPVKEQAKPKIAALLLGAGQSRRMGPQNKLLALINGKPMVRHTAEALTGSMVDHVVIVTGHEARQVLNTVWDLDIPSIQNDDYADGLSASVKLGFSLLAKDYDGILICLGDMPFITSDQINKLIETFNPLEGRAIVTPTFQGKRGNPVLISTQFADEVSNITGDMGAKAIISENDHLVQSVEFDSPAIFTDIDTPEKLAVVTDAASKE